MGVNNPEPAYFWDTSVNAFRKAVVGEPGEYVWNTTTESWVFGAIGAEYVWNATTQSWDFGSIGGEYVRNTTTNSWDKVTTPGGGGTHYWDTTTNSWVLNTSAAIAAERATEAGDIRLTEAGDIRIIE